MMTPKFEQTLCGESEVNQEHTEKTGLWLLTQLPSMSMLNKRHQHEQDPWHETTAGGDHVRVGVGEDKRQ